MANDKKQCSCCGKEKKMLDYYMSKSFTNKYSQKMSVCKTCVGEAYDRYFKKYEDEKMSLYYMCRALFICFNLSSYESALGERITNKPNTPIWQIYMTKLNSIGSKNGAGEDFDSSDNIDVKSELDAIKEERGLDEEVEIRWGSLPETDIAYLEYNYTQWTTRHQCESRAEEILYEEICHLQLDIKKTREGNGDVVKKVEALQKLMGSANIRPLDQNAMNVNESAMLWGTTILTIEKNEPCEFFDEYKRKEYSDFMGYRWYFNNWILRPLKNLLASHKDYNITLEEDFAMEENPDGINK